MQPTPPGTAAVESDLLVVPSSPRQDEDCPICLAPLTESCVVTPCAHRFHAGCLDQYFMVLRQPGRRPACPICRGPVYAPLPVDAFAASGRPIEVCQVPTTGGRVHFDRTYQFLSLGSFDSRGMLYVCTSNDDRKTSATSVMWTIACTVPITVHLNFRSARHLKAPGVEDWLRRGGWARNEAMESAHTSGIPNGPYSGPIVSRECEPGRIELYGSNCWEGTYLVFIAPRPPVGGEAVPVDG